jgi:hypothetical protein
MLMSHTIDWVTPTEAKTILREAAPAMQCLRLETLIQRKARGRLVFKDGRIALASADRQTPDPHEDEATPSVSPEFKQPKSKAIPIDYVETEYNKEQPPLPELAFSDASHGSDCHMQFAEKMPTVEIAVGPTASASQQRSCSAHEQKVDQAGPAGDVLSRVLPQHAGEQQPQHVAEENESAAPCQQTTDSAQKRPWPPRSFVPCPPELSHDVSDHKGVRSFNEALNGRCISANESFVCEAPMDKALLSRAYLLKKDPADLHFVADIGGMTDSWIDQHETASTPFSEERTSLQKLSTAGCVQSERASVKSDSALFGLETDVRPVSVLGCNVPVASTDGHRAAHDILLDECISALRATVSKAPGSNISLASIQVALEQMNPNYGPLIESEGGIEHFVRTCAHASCSLICDAWDNVWVTRPSTAAERPATGHMDEGAVADCIAALEVILAEAPDGKLSLGSIETALSDGEHLALYHQAIEHEGGVSCFVRAHAEGRIYLYNTAGTDVWLACHPPHPDIAVPEKQGSGDDAESDHIQRCAAALEAIVSKAPEGRLKIAAVGNSLYKREPNFHELVTSLGGLQRLVREHCQGRLSFSDADRHVCLAHHEKNSMTPAIFKAQAMPSAKGSGPVQRCISALEAIVSNAPEGRLGICSVGGHLYERDPAYRELVKRAGGLQRFVRKHGQGRLSFSEDGYLCLAHQKGNFGISTAQAMSSAEGDPVQQCASALEAIVSNAPEGRLDICSVGGPLYESDPAYRELIKRAGGLQRFVRAHCQGRLSYSDVYGSVCLAHQEGNFGTPAISTAHVVPSVEGGDRVQRCISALEAIVSNAPRARLKLCRVGGPLYKRDPAYRELIKSAGGLHQFLRAHCQDRLAFSDVDSTVRRLQRHQKPPPTAHKANDGRVPDLPLAAERVPQGADKAIKPVSETLSLSAPAGVGLAKSGIGEGLAESETALCSAADLHAMRSTARDSVTGYNNDNYRLVQGCADALKAILAEAPGGRLPLAFVGAALYERFVRDSGESHISLVEVDSEPWLACATPSAPRVPAAKVEVHDPDDGMVQNRMLTSD